MTSKSFLQRLSRSSNISIGKEGSEGYKSMSFGGAGVILYGDLHQFPPVTGFLREHLFHPMD
jgi:hypothetical protein